MKDMNPIKTQAVQDALRQIRELVGEAGWITGEAQAPLLKEWRGRYHGVAAAVICPTSTEEVAAVLRMCHKAGLSVVPQSGNTGLCGGAAPDASGTQILLNLRRMRRIRELDPDNYTMTAEAGCILADLQQAAREASRLFPLSLASEGSCMIGGNLATNAGGTNVLRYGNARDLTLGVEVVLADGRIWNGLSSLRKDNSGFDLRDLFVGSEGTLGIITAAVLKLFPTPRQTATALLAMDSAEQAVMLLGRLREASGDTLTGCELMSCNSFRMAVEHVAGCTDPFDAPHCWYMLVEASTAEAGNHLREHLETALGDAHGTDLLSDAVLAESLQQAAALWKIRESIPEAQVHAGASIKHDISVPVSRIPDFLRVTTPRIEAAVPGVRVCAFGHVGDGNLHYNLSQPLDAEPKAFMAREADCNRIVYERVLGMGGSIAAEHGVGQRRVEELEQYKSPVELALMRQVKQALDPTGILNPGKVIRIGS